MTKKLPISQFYKQKLAAPLHNTLWSWGSENAKGVYLRAWNRNVVDGMFDIGSPGMVVDNEGRTRSGGVERAKHIKAIESGKPGYIVAIDGYIDAAGKSHITDYNDKALFKIVALHHCASGVVFAEVDRHNPILIEAIGDEIDPMQIIASVENRNALAQLAKAQKLGWQITGSTPKGVTLLLKGKKTGLITFDGDFIPS